MGNTPAGLIETETDPRNVVTKYEYTGPWLERVSYAFGTDEEHVIFYYGHDAVGNPDYTIVTNRDWDDESLSYQPTQTLYDELDRVREVIPPTTSTSGINSSPKTQQTYTAVGYLTDSKLVPFGSQPITTKTFYGIRHQVESTVENYKAASYNNGDPPPLPVDENVIYRSEYDAVGNLVASIDPLGWRTDYEYDGIDRNTFVMMPGGATIETRFDGVDDVIVELGPEREATYYERNKRGWAEKIDGPNGYRELWEYYEDGKTKTATDAQNRITKYEYDNADRLTKTFLPDPNESGMPGTNFIENEYDPNGNLRYQTDANGIKSENQYDLHNRLQRTLDGKQRVIGGITGMFYYYDSAGNLRITRDANGNEVEYEYDLLNRPVKEIRHAQTAQNNESTQSYDAYGRLYETIDREGDTIRYGYDQLHRSTLENWIGDPYQLTTEYDKAGQITEVADNFSTYGFTYNNGLGLADLETQTIVGLGSVTFQREYYPDGMVKKTTSSVGHVDEFKYTGLNQLEQVTRTSSSNQLQIDAKYYRDKRIDEISRVEGSNTVTTDFDYDGRGRLESQTHKNPNSSTLEKYSFGYDAGDRTKQIDYLMADLDIDDIIYDDANQVEEVIRPNSDDEDYEYDNNHNRTLADGFIYDIGDDNRLDRDGVYDYEYFPDGNREERSTLDETVTYEFDHRNRLIRVDEVVTGNYTTTIEYTYDMYDRLIARKVDQQPTEYYVYQGSAPVARYEGGTPKKRYLWALGSLQGEEELASNGNVTADYWTLADHKGSIVFRVKPDGDPYRTLHYDSQGELIEAVGPGNLDDAFFGYMGMLNDDEIGIMNSGSRWYDSRTGRWLDQSGVLNNPYDADLDETGTATWTWNDYFYYLSNPDEMDGDLRFGFYAAATVGAVSLGAASAGMAAGLGAGGAIAGSTVATGSVYGATAGGAIGAGIAGATNQNVASGFAIGALSGAAGGGVGSAFGAGTTGAVVASGGISGGVEGAVETALRGGSAGDIIASALIDGAIGAVSAGVLDNFARGARRLGDEPVHSCPLSRSFNSFTPETPVLMADGSHKPISQIMIGDWVMAADPESGDEGPRQVTNVITGDGEKHLVEIEIDDDVITATADHPFWVASRSQWVDAGEIKVGDLVLSDDGSAIAVQSLRSYTVSYQVVNNLTVDDLHTYYVMAGDDAVLVHNCSATKEESGSRIGQASRRFCENAQRKESPPACRRPSELERGFLQADERSRCGNLVPPQGG